VWVLPLACCVNGARLLQQATKQPGCWPVDVSVVCVHPRSGAVWVGGQARSCEVGEAGGGRALSGSEQS
jgi:hypothetical protein